MPKRNRMSEAREGNMKHKGFDLNECALSPNAEPDEKTGVEQVKGLPSEAESLAYDLTETMENVTETTKKTKMKLQLIDCEVNITRRVLRSGSVAMDPAGCNKRPGAVEEKRKGAHKGDLSMGDNMKKTIGTSSVDEVIEYVESHLPRGDELDERSGDGDGSCGPHGKVVQVKRTRGRPQKLQLSCQSDVNKDKFIGVSYAKEDKSKLQLDYEQSAEAKKIRGANFRSQVEVEIKDDRSYDGNENAESYDKGPKIKRKRGRPRKLQTSSQSDESGSNTNCKLARSPGLNSQPDSRICRGRKMVCKRGRPPKPRMKRKSEETDESDCKAKKRLKHRESPLESQHNNPLVDCKKRIEEQQNKPKEAGRQSKSEYKKMLCDRILQLLLAAGWTVQYRPRNGKDYSDAVYVNPKGKTHWSVTKAYKNYKEHLESIMNDPVNSFTSSGFGLLPEEDLQLLERNTQKQRSDKGKQRPNWKDRNTNENMVSSKRQGKRTLHGKRLQKEKIRMQKKRKESYGSHNLERVSVSVRKIKREEKHNSKRCALSARSSLVDENSKENGYILFEGKRTVLGWMIDSAIVPLNGRVQCMDCRKTQVRLEGIITKEGIRCNCCDNVFSVLDFEVHSGRKHNKPFKSLYLESGDSILQCLLESWNKQSESLLKGFHFVDFGGGDQNDDTCGICGDGGDLICCDGCPSTFHQSCLGIKKFPSGAWFCCYCSCKFCEKVEAENHNTTTPSPLSRCHLCQEKYHHACIRQDGMVPGERSTLSFCGKYCQELFEGLQLLIGVKHPLPEGFSWTFLRRFELPREVSDGDISEKIAYNAKLAVAFSVMDECFSPLVDHRSGVNLLENIVYNFGSNFDRLNYSSFLTAVLERGDEIIAVASIRIHGNQLAEMPFIGTRYMYRRQGMCRRLMSGIESALGSLKVDKLVIPAVPELMDTWTSGFGFKPIHETAKETIKNLNLVVFPGVDMLEKMIEPHVSSSNGYLLLAPEMSLPVDAEENKPEESKDSEHGQNCATADVESPSCPVDSSLKLMNVEEGNNDAKSVLKLPDHSVEEKERIGNLADKDVDSLPDVIDNKRESNTEVADDSHQDQADTKWLESGDLEDEMFSDDGCEGKAVGSKESNDQLDCYIIEDSQPLGNGGRVKEIGNKTLAQKKEVTSRLEYRPD